MRRTALPLALLITSACQDPAANTTTNTELGTESSTTMTTSAETTGTGEGTGETGSEPIPPDAIWLDVQLDTALTEVDERFLSYALDTDKLVYQSFDFSRPRLIALTAELSPALLRIGGTKADRVYYDLSDMPIDPAPAPYTGVLDRAKWDAACEFADALGVEMMFTINAGPGPRDQAELWVDSQARELIEYSVQQGCPVQAWEFGNEVGSFGLEHGLSLSGEEYAVDFGVFAALVDELDPQALKAGPAAAYWPVEGEVPIKIIPGLVADTGAVLDVLTWHYYPQQSTSCPIGSRRVDEPVPPQAWLETVEQWATEVEDHRDANAPNAAVWLGETGHAQCGGEPGISDTFASSFWWLDQLGRIARRGQPIVARQALSGGAYKLIEDSNLEPTPDYYASVLWKRHMGARVLATTTIDGPETLHTYAHCDVSTPGGVAVLLINYDATQALSVALVEDGTAYEAAIVTASSITAPEIVVNGEAWVANADGSVPPAPSMAGASWLSLPPLSYAFVRLPELGAAACN